MEIRFTEKQDERLIVKLCEFHVNYKESDTFHTQDR